MPFREEQLQLARQQGRMHNSIVERSVYADVLLCPSAMAQRQQEYDHERQVMHEETHQLYLYQREQMYKRLQSNFLNHRKMIETAKREYLNQRGNDTDSDSGDDGRGPRRRDRRTPPMPLQQLKRGEVMVVTTEKGERGPAKRLLQRLCPFGYSAWLPNSGLMWMD
jgi:hypothetical protein